MAAAPDTSDKVRARAAGIPFESTPGALNAITDVPGVAVGHTTILRGSGALRVGVGPVRTGVTVVFPRHADPRDAVFAGWFALNGNGEMTGSAWVKESGFLEGPIAITNTHSVGVVRDTIIGWQAERDVLLQPWSLPVVAETYDGWLNDINGFHVKPQHVIAALDDASTGPVAEGNVGGGTGMICYGFKGGIGTASRQVMDDVNAHTVGVLVQANFGRRDQLRIDGVPVGSELAHEHGPGQRADQELGSIIGIVATDAPLLPHQLERIARRASLGVARTGATSGNGSGDIFLAFSTANPRTARTAPAATVQMLSNARIDPLFDATVYATEEAIINALFAADTMTGRDDHVVDALPQNRVAEILAERRQHRR